MSTATLTYTSYYASGTWYDNVISFQGPYIKGFDSYSYLFGTLYTVSLNVTSGYTVNSLTFTLPKVMATGTSGNITLYAFLYDHNPKSEFSGYTPSIYAIRQGSASVSVNSSDNSKTVSISGLSITTNGSYYVFITSDGLINNTNPVMHSPSSVTCAVSESMIPKPATSISVSSTLYMGTATTISWTPFVSGYTYKVTYKFTGQSSETNIVASTSSSSCSWTPPTSLGINIPNSTSGTATIYVYTYNGGSQVGSKCSQNVTINIPSSGRNPTCSSGWASASATSFVGAYIAGKSVISATVDTSKITYSYGATEKSITASCNSSSQTFTASDTKNLGYAVSGSNVITITVTDSRGYSTTYSKTISATNYSAPSFTSLTVVRSNNSGTESTSGTYYAVTPSVSWTSVGSNALVIQTRYKTLSGSYGSYSNCTNNTKTTHGGGNISASNSYIIEVSAYDSITGSNDRVTQTRTVTNTTVLATFNLKSNGIGAAFFGLSQNDNELTVNGAIRSTANMIIDGTGKLILNSSMYGTSDPPTTGAVVGQIYLKLIN